jgi:GNAT superfamily N-acetyltransferase
MLTATLTGSDADLQGILELQQRNHFSTLGESEIKSEGFLTLKHDLTSLQQLHQIAPSVIVKNERDTVVGYALTMLPECRQLIPDLEPMFALFDHLKWQDRALSQYRFYVMGQVCVSKEYRGQGIFEMLYRHHKKMYQAKFNLFITEIATRNARSLRAHEKIGFRPIHQYRDHLDEWLVVAWDWN